MIKKFRIVYSVFVLLLLLSIQFISTSFFGGAHMANCSGCHGGGTDPGGSVTVSGLPLAYAHSTVYPVTVCVTDPSKLGAGFNMVGNIGSFVGGAGSTVSGTSITHSSPQSFGGGTFFCWNFSWVSPISGTTTATFTTRGNAVNLDGFNSGDNGGYFTSNSVVVPVDLVSFDAKSEKDKIHLSWSTASEYNTEYFEIQKSKNGLDWQEIDKIPATGFTSEMQDYFYTDILYSVNSSNAQTLYYRLKIVDYDGKQDWSAIKSVTVSQEQKDFNFYPNPAKDHIILSDLPQREELTLTLLDYSGKIAYSKKLLYGNTSQRIDLYDDLLANGLYVLQIHSDSQGIIGKKKLLIAN